MIIYYFLAAPMAGDVDNILKPILDALVGIAYLDDHLVERVLSQKFEPETDWSFDAPTERLSAALDTRSASEEPAPVVYILIDNDLSWRRLYCLQQLITNRPIPRCEPSRVSWRLFGLSHATI
ncbi:RusA family crossover junction endodeoxyribonuclease, partial [Sphingomonas sp.]|uniref:RusA family crossover junction endodeoxyribonuclease n=1 Tax=Sphingomonas sp. TaxID=28214 RepID=UPI0033422C83